jgi:adenosylmethionine---8-amino-7-oxononanoate aminotransferase
MTDSTAQADAARRTRDDLVAYDRAHVWHPYSSMADPADPILIKRAAGVRIETAEGESLIDAMSSWWCAIHGYRHPALDAAVRGQLSTMAHVMFGGLTHEPAIALAETLVGMTPDGLDRVFFADSGSVSVEVALKMAVQAQRGRGQPRKTRVLALRGGYHGDTAGAMAVCDPVSGMHAMFAGVLPQQIFAPRPPAGYDADIEEWTAEVSALVARHADELAAIVCEPVLQGAGGMHVYSPRCLIELRRLADEHGAFLILDEIATGFGRTGELFAADHARVRPDIMCVGKALTGGYMTLAATLCTADVADAIASSESGALMHGPTFMANPLACAAANANLTLLADGRWRADVARIEARLAAGLACARDASTVADVRVLGAVGVIQLHEPVEVGAASAAARKLGVWIRPFRDLVYTMPPYVVDDDDLDAICHAIVEAALA